MGISEARRAANTKWDAVNMAYQTIKIPRALLENFKIACGVRGDKVNTVLRHAMEQYVAETPAELIEGGLEMSYSEDTLRKRAKKIGFQIEKGFHHNDDGEIVRREWQGRIVGYQVKDLSDGSYVWSSNIEGGADHCWSLDEVENFLRDAYRDRGLEW